MVTNFLAVLIKKKKKTFFRGVNKKLQDSRRNILLSVCFLAHNLFYVQDNHYGIPPVSSLVRMYLAS